MRTFQEYLVSTGRFDEIFGFGKKKELESEKESPYHRYLRLSAKVPGLGHKPIDPDKDRPADEKESDYMNRWEKGS